MPVNRTRREFLEYLFKITSAAAAAPLLNFASTVEAKTPDKNVSDRMKAAQEYQKLTIEQRAEYCSRRLFELNMWHASFLISRFPQ